MSIIKKTNYWIIGFFFFGLVSDLTSQDQRIADSLTQIYRADTLSGRNRLQLLSDLSFNEMKDHELALQYTRELIDLSEQVNDQYYLFQGYFQKGNALRFLGELEQAIEAYFTSAEIARNGNFRSLEGSALGAIADIYAISENYDNAMLYYHKAIDVLSESTDSVALASYVSNAGDAFLNMEKFDSALIYFEHAGNLFEQLDYALGQAYSIGNKGIVYAHIGHHQLAEQHINEATDILKQSGDNYSISVYLIAMSEIYTGKGNLQQAILYAKQSLDLARHAGLKDQLSDSHLQLSKLYTQTNNTKLAFDHYKRHVTYRDSVSNIATVQAIADLRTDYEVSQKQVEVDLLNQQKKNQRNILIFLAVVLGIVIVVLGVLYRLFSIISREKKRSEELLLNILPEATARELKEKGHVDAVKFETVTVLFTDFVQFSSIAEKTDPERLVKSIDFYFKKFDEITTKYGLEKIKTIGDAYMCAGGLPIPSPGNEKNVVLAGLEIVEFVNRTMRSKNGITQFQIRVGIHTGPVVAGIVGTKKWQYDIWGDTVNIASRMESNSDPGRVNLSEVTHQKIKEEFPCIYRGEIEVKNRGALKMYFLDEAQIN